MILTNCLTKSQEVNMKKLFLFVLAFSGMIAQAQFTIPDKPSFQTSVYDYEDILNSSDEKRLEEKLVRYSDSTSTQIVVITIPSLQGEDVGVLATNWAHKWGIGQKDKNNGVVFLWAPGDRKIFIATGYGAEGGLTDAYSKRIIEQVVKPNFKQLRYYQGLDEATNSIFKYLSFSDR